MRFFALAKSLRSFLLRLLITMGGLLILIPSSYAQKYQFDHYNKKDGLSQITVYSIIQDSLGFMWFGTQNGLNRFDGYSFKVFSDESIERNQIKVLAEEKVKDRFLIGTTQGVFRFDLNTESFTSLLDNGNTFSVNALVVDEQQNLWIGAEEGLYTISLLKGPNQELKPVKGIRGSINALAIRHGSLRWVGTSEGLYKYNLENDSLSYFKLTGVSKAKAVISSLHYSGSSNTLYIGTGTEKGHIISLNDPDIQKPTTRLIRNLNDPVVAIHLAKEGKLWVGLKNQGIRILNPSNLSTDKRLIARVSEPKRLSDNHILSFYQDNQDGIWIGTFAGGVNRYNKDKNVFTHLLYLDSLGNQGGDSFFWCTWEDKDGSLLLGKENGGIIRYFPKNGSFEAVPFYTSTSKGKLDYNSKISVRQIFQDNQDVLWAATSKGLMKYDYLPQRNGGPKAFQEILGLFGGEEVAIQNIAQLPKTDTLLLGTKSKGIYLFDISKGIPAIEDVTFAKKLKDTTVNIFTIFSDPDSQNIVWIGTRNHGLARRDYSKLNNESNIKYWEGTSVYTIIQNRENSNQLWIGTKGEGLKIFEKGSYKYCTNSKPSFKGSIYSIIDDPNNSCLWMAGHNGVIRYDLNTKTINILNEQHGLIDSEFNLGAGIKTKNGKIYFAQGNNGLVSFNPSKYLHLNSLDSPVRFTQILLGENEYVFGDKIANPYSQILNSKNIYPTVYGKFGDREIKVHFSILEYSLPKSINYNVLVTNDSNDTILTKRRTFNESNITIPFKANDYFFRSKEVYQIKVESNGFENNINNLFGPAELRVVISSPFWLSWWLITIGTLSIVGLLFWAIGSSQALGRNKELTKKNERLEELHSRINNISRQESLNQVCELAMRDMIRFFKFDYASLSIVNHLSREIEVKYNESKTGSRVNPKAWQESGRKFPLNGKDILPNVVTNDQEYIVVGNVINGEEIEINESSILDQEIFHKHKHNDLVRAFLPMKRRAKREKGEKGDYPIGVFEVGYHRSTKKQIKEQDLIDLKLYIDNCAQLYYKNHLVNEDIEISIDLSTFQEEENPNHYLEKITEFLAKKVYATKGYFSLVSYHKNEEYVSPPVRGYGISQKELKGVRESNRRSKAPRVGIYMHVSETKMPYWTNDVDKDPFYMHGLKEVKSQISIPLIYKEKALGALNLYSPHHAHFDEKKASVLKKYMDQVGGPYVKKKADEATKKLVKPLNIFSDKEVYGPLVDAIGDYFQVTYVGIFEHNNDEENGEYEKYCFKFINRDIYLETGQIELEKKMKKGKMISDIKTFAKHNNNPFYNLIRKFNLYFPSAIQAPIYVGNNVIANFIIFLNSQEETLLPEELIFLNLIGQKGGMAIGMAQIVRSLESLSKLAITTQNLNGFLRELTRKALLLNLGNPIILFPYKEDQEIKFKDGVYAGEFLEDRIKQMYRGKTKAGENRIDLANIIVKEGTKWFRNETDFKAYLETIKKIRKWDGQQFNHDFWTREKIKSLAVIRLEFDRKPVGVLFFNYRTQRDFTDENRRFIEAFSFMATNAIVNANRADFFREKRIQAEEGEFQQIQRAEEAESAYRTLTRGINHDIRNNLMQIALLQEELELNFFSQLSNKQKTAFNLIWEKITSNANSIEDLLKAFGSKNEKNEWINIDKLIDRVIKTYQVKEERRKDKDTSGKHIVFSKKKTSGSFPTILGNPKLLSMVVHNLLSNSFKAVKEKIASSNRKVGSIHIENQSSDDSLIIAIIDNGIGIDNKIKPKVFDPYFSHSQGGIGYGLYFSKEIIEKNFNGSIYFTSSYNQETKFFIKIPLDS